MGLQEGTGSFGDKIPREKRELWQPDNLQKEIQPGNFGVFQYPQPFLFVTEKELSPFVKLVHGNTEALTETLEGRTPEKGLGQDPEDKEKAITGIGDNHIREDGMGVPAAFAGQPENRDLLYDGLSMDKIDDAAAVVSMDMAVTGGTADGTGFPLRTEGIHVRPKQNF